MDKRPSSDTQLCRGLCSVKILSAEEMPIHPFALTGQAYYWFDVHWDDRRQTL